jgi:predicted nucleic acid-binding Zn ribbon protein
MRKAGDILAAFFDETTLKQANTYGELFSARLWYELLEKCGLSQGVSHTRIADLNKTILLIEADHPGWIQLLQTKQTALLESIQRRFPELALTGISFKLSRPDTSSQ